MDDVEWVVERCAPGTPAMCAIESARGLLAASTIAAHPRVVRLAMGGLDLRRDLDSDGSQNSFLFARSSLVVASAAAAIPPPVDTVFPHVRDDEGLEEESKYVRRLGFGGKSAIHPRQLATIRRVFLPDSAEVQWADDVLQALTVSGGKPTTLATGEFIDSPVEARATRILAAHHSAQN